MDKKTACCGCGCLVIIIAIIAIGVGGYFGVSFLHSAGKDVAAKTFEKTIDSVTAKAFGEMDREEIKSGAKKVTQGILDGKIGLFSLFTEGTQQLEGGIYTKIILLAFKNHYLMNAEDGAEAEISVTGAKSVNRLLFGLSEKRVSQDQIASIALKITEHFQDQIPDPEGKSKMKFSSRRINSTLSKEDVQECLKMINEVCDLNEIAIPAEDYSPETTIKSEILTVFARLQKPEEKKK